MKKLLLLAVIAITSLPMTAQTLTRMLGSSPFQDSLWAIDTATWTVTRRIGPTPSSGGTITGMTGLAKDPTTDQVYMICKQSATTGRTLAAYNPATGVANIIGNLGDNFSSITFTSNGRLFGATGNGATVPEALYSINKTTAAKTLIKSMGNGADGEIICANPDDNNMLYHWSGNGTIVYEKLDTLTAAYTPTNIPIIGTTTGETFGMVYIGNNKFIGSNISSSFNRWNTAGNVSTAFGANPDDLRGLVIIHCDRTITASSTSICGSSPVTLTASNGAGAYQWYLNGAPMSGETNQTLSATAAGHYNVRYTDGCGIDSLGTAINLVASPLPVVSFTTSGSTTFCAGSSVTINAGVTSNANPGYQWYMNGAPIAGETNPSYTANASGVYNLISTNLTTGCSDSAASGTTVVVNALPVVSLSAASSSFCSGDSVALTANAPAGTYQWYMNGSMVASATASTYNALSGGVYNMVCTDANGCIDSSASSLTITENPLPVAAFSSSVTACNSYTLDAGNAGSSFMWQDSTTSQTLLVITSGIYSVSITDGNGCVGTGSSSVTINPNPTVNLGADTTVCGGIVLDAGNSGSTYLWQDSSTTTQTFSANTSGSYGVEVTDANGCVGVDSVSVVVNANPSVTLSIATASMCLSDASLALSGGSPAGGSFSGPGVTGSNFNPSAAGVGSQTITYSFTDNNGCSGTATDFILVDSCLAVQNMELAASFSIFPNPNNGSFTLTIADQQIGNGTIEILSVDGKQIVRENIQVNGNYTRTFDVSNLAAGTYFVKVSSESGTAIKRIVRLD